MPAAERIWPDTSATVTLSGDSPGTEAATVCMIVFTLASSRGRDGATITDARAASASSVKRRFSGIERCTVAVSTSSSFIRLRVSSPSSARW
jgi:hypothetical protein